jgi:hypothetical protein
MREVVIECNSSDACSGAPALSVEVTHDEDADGQGDGAFEPDFEVIEVDSVNGFIRLNLRAERSGKGDGRVYTITVTATDTSGNETMAETFVEVPHNRKGKK